MPSGKVHTALTLATASGILAPYAIVQFNMNPWMYGAGAVVGIFISPDLDVDKGNIADTIIRKVFSPAQWIWRAFWQPYAWSIPHRHSISHFPLLGTVLRIGYIFLIVNIVVWIVNLFFDTLSFVWIWNWDFFLGLAHVDVIHWLADNTIKGKEMFDEQ